MPILRRSSLCWECYVWNVLGDKVCGMRAFFHFHAWALPLLRLVSSTGITTAKANTCAGDLGELGRVAWCGAWTRNFLNAALSRHLRKHVQVLRTAELETLNLQHIPRYNRSRQPLGSLPACLFVPGGRCCSPDMELWISQPPPCQRAGRRIPLACSHPSARGGSWSCRLRELLGKSCLPPWLWFGAWGAGLPLGGGNPRAMSLLVQGGHGARCPGSAQPRRTDLPSRVSSASDLLNYSSPCQWLLFTAIPSL